MTIHNSRVTSVIFAGALTSSSDGVLFMNATSGTADVRHKSADQCLSLAVVPSAKVVFGVCDNCVSLFRTADGALFRQSRLSASAYPLSIAVDRFGLFVAAALIDAETLSLQSIHTRA
jgi:hypothetical protein